ncbi:Delta(3,5)-Delta(2,4)-dienoyl-CoA isomerase, mitochondrial [Sciurus carolinensis]|uniref:Delta(3,5)-Delta(2,4)-dienoyl-CoA isomerase, mitochondrial n=1 Tax=Sciurus carolinensis TaxID=30640 RepID=A0AA41STF7_SCICA|nr:Delta(3,5)-Delta(2,4)-dienoyl-CoA isomerase, mitochondrial [Sciurus carolinensis]
MVAAMMASSNLYNLLMRRLSVPIQQGLSVGLHPMGSAAQEQASRAAPCDASDHSYESLLMTAAQKHILHVQLKGPDKRNAMNKAFWREMVECFIKIAQDSKCRAVVISGAGKTFTSGIDLMEWLQTCCSLKGTMWPASADTCMTSSADTSVIKKCPKLVIAAVHWGCVQAGHAVFQVKEVNVGLAADVGTLQWLPKSIRNQSLVNELAFTAGKMMVDEALSSGLVIHVFPDKWLLLDAAFALAAEIASKSPVAMQSTKINLLYSCDRPVSEGLNYMATWNMSM